MCINARMEDLWMKFDEPIYEFDLGVMFHQVM